LHKFDIPPFWALAHVAAALILSYLWPIWDFSQFVSNWASIALILAGLALMFWTIRWFRHKATTIDPRQTPSSLITEGPFRYSRNPIYLGMALILLGWGLWLGTLSAMLLPFLFVAIITKRFILREEANLRNSFGNEADAYIAKTRRW
jgi:protein-S-isoprenylcysteine O-methyltransferase Ste14